MVRVSVKNFGPIAEGSVDLKPLTIFIGPSNTGKSYMAGAIYAVMKSALERHRVPYAAQFGPAAGSESGRDPNDVSFSELPCEVRSRLESEVTRAIENVRETALIQMRAYYDPTFQFVRRGREIADFRLDLYRDEPLLQLNICLEDTGNIPPIRHIVHVSPTGDTTAFDP